MALTFFEEGPVSLDPRAALHVPIGAASPLWLLFAGAATSGMAYWWMTRWAAYTHIEATPFAAPVAAAAEFEVPPPEQVAVAAAQLIAEPAEAIEQSAEQRAPLIEALEPAAVAPELAPEPIKPKTKAKPADEPPPGL